jgi:hypothetical protein
MVVAAVILVQVVELPVITQVYPVASVRTVLMQPQAVAQVVALVVGVGVEV